MDDFLEMEKLAYQSSDTNAAVSIPDVPNNARPETTKVDTSMHVTTIPDSQLKEHNETSTSGNEAFVKRKKLTFKEFKRISERLCRKCNNAVLPQSTTSIVETTLSSKTATESQPSLDDGETNIEKEIPVSEDSKSCNESVHGISKELIDAMSQIHDFVLFLGKEAKAIQGTAPDGSGINEKLDDFSATYAEVISSRLSMVNFVLDLSRVLSNASELHFNILGYKNSETEISTSDCIDKVALPENKGLQHSEEVYANGCSHFSDSTSDPDIPHEGSLVPTSESTSSFEVPEELLAEVKSQLVSAQKANSLAETQLRSLDNELQEEKKGHQDALATCKDLEEQLQRMESAADLDATPARKKSYQLSREAG
ncbi:hypothetical protein HAX54_000365 [Datura stramonium]|uniref:Uncharacterized protein n=1 Tax=Datura stramonium TaxID=4076 RepID=A0ABS8WPX3_DATST|nr:hypothetical protein [Datura stramonium]